MMAAVEVTEEDADDGTKERQKTRFSDPQQEQPKELS